MVSPTESHWKPTAYLRSGFFCSPATLRNFLREISKRCNAEATVLFVCHRARLFHSLILCGSLDREIGKRIEDRFQRSSLQNSVDTRSRLEDVLRSLNRARTFGEACQGFGVKVNAPLRTKTVVTAVRSGLSEDLPSAPDPDLSLCVVVLGEAAESPNEDLIGSLIDHVVSTVHYRVRKQMSPGRDFERAAFRAEHEVTAALSQSRVSPPTVSVPHTPEPGIAWDPTPGPAFCTSMLSLLCREANGSAAALYSVSRDSAKLREQPLATYGDRSQLGTSQAQKAVTGAFDTNRAHIKASRVSNASRQRGYLAYPIVYRRFNTPRAECLGVILFTVLTKAPGYAFTDHHLKLLDAFATQLRRHYEWRLLRESTALLQHGPTGPPDDPAYDPGAWDKYICFDDPKVVSSEDPHVSVLPHESQMQSLRLLATISGLYSLTRARSVALRLLTTDSRYLIRCINMYGDVRGTGRVRSVSKKPDRSANVWAVTHNRPCDIENFHEYEGKQAKWKKQHPGLVEVELQRTSDELASLYCTPIRTHGRVVGTLNVESVYPYAFSSSKYLIESIAAHVGWLLEEQQAENERLLQISSPVGTVVHTRSQLERAMKVLDEHIDVNPSLQEAADIFRRHVSEMNIDFDRTEDAATGLEGATLHALIDEALKRVDVAQEKILAPESEAMQMVPFPDQADAKSLLYCLTEMIGNAQRYKPDSAAIQISASMRPTPSQAWLRIAIKNKVKNCPPKNLTSLMSRFGRVEIEREDSVHWGALSTGATVRRQLGGELYVNNIDEDFFKVVIEVPVHRP